MRFESDDLTSELGAAAVQGSVQEKLVRAYELAGIRPGACTFAFGRDGRFTATAGSRTLAGTYAFDAATHEIVLDIERKSGRTLSVPGHAYLSGSGLQLVFPVTKLVETIEAFGSGARKSRRAARTLPRRLPRVRVRPQLTAGYGGTLERRNVGTGIGPRRAKRPRAGRRHRIRIGRLTGRAGRRFCIRHIGPSAPGGTSASRVLQKFPFIQ